MGKNKKFARIYENNVKIVYRYIYARLFNKSMVEDLTSKTFEIAYSKFIEDDMEGLDNPKTWLIQIARNVMGNHIQKKKIRGAPVEDLNLPVDNDPLLDQQISEEQMSQVKEYFENLDADTREVITLKIWEGYKFREIAEITGLNESSAKTLYYRGLKKIKEAMQDKEKEKREYAVVIAGLSALKSTSAFTPSNAFVQTALTKISMEAARAAGSNMSNLLDKTVNLFGKSLKVKQVLVGVMVVVGVGAGVGGVMYGNSQQLQDNEVQEEEEQSQDEEKNTNDQIMETKSVRLDNCPINRIGKVEDGYGWISFKYPLKVDYNKISDSWSTCDLKFAYQDFSLKIQSPFMFAGEVAPKAIQDESKENFYKELEYVDGEKYARVKRNEDEILYYRELTGEDCALLGDDIKRCGLSGSPGLNDNNAGSVSIVVDISQDDYSEEELEEALKLFDYIVLSLEAGENSEDSEVKNPDADSDDENKGTDLWVERKIEINSLPDTSIVKRITLKLPADAIVSEEPMGYTTVGVVNYEGSELRFSLPHGGVEFHKQGFESYSIVSSKYLGEIYRVVSEHSNADVGYVDELKKEGSCETGFPDNPLVDSPCGNFVLKEVVVHCSNSSNNYSFCDNVMSNFNVVSVN
jgi:RNA polymerase sigma-70 factor (ECF subfamily)